MLLWFDSISSVHTLPYLMLQDIQYLPREVQPQGHALDRRLTIGREYCQGRDSSQGGCPGCAATV